MQLTLQLPQFCNCLDTSSNASSGSSSPSCISFEGGPATPSANCDVRCTAVSKESPQPLQKQQRSVFRGLQLTVPGSRPVVQADSSCMPTARRLLNTRSSYDDVCHWLDQQVSQREGTQGRMVAACSHTSLALDPELASPATPAQAEALVGGLPGPAFQLLGLL